MRDRKCILLDIIHFDGEMEELQSELSLYTWDSDEMVILYKKDVRYAIALFEDGIIDSLLIESWANALECRDDVSFESAKVQEAINQLANPILFGEITLARTEEVRTALLG